MQVFSYIKTASCTIIIIQKGTVDKVSLAKSLLNNKEKKLRLWQKK